MGASWALRTRLSTDEVNLALPALERAGLLGIVEEQGRATVYFPQRVDGLELAGEWAEVPDRDWDAEWKRGITPVQAGGFVIAPPWLADGSDPDVIVIEPAQAFGTGHHATTTGCLEALAARDLAGRSVLDVGTGTGVLAIAARRLGAARVLALDIDEIAVATARDNARRNGVEVEVRLGSVEAAGGFFDVVVANLDTSTLTVLAPALAACLAPGGTLVASGVSVERGEQAGQALRAAGLAANGRVLGEWLVLVAAPAS